MKSRHVVMLANTVLMVGALILGAVQVLDAQPSHAAARAALENVRDYAAAVNADSPSYAVDAGVLLAGMHGRWSEINTPRDIIVSAVALDSRLPDAVYIGAANELSLFRSVDAGASWLRVPLSDAPGGITDIAVDGAQRLIYAGTDTAGLFRLRDVGDSVIVGGQLLLEEPVRQVATDSSGASLAFVRTDSTLYRAENYGLAWSAVETLHSSPTAIAVANTEPVMVYVGTTDRGVVASSDGLTWSLANEGLGLLPGTRLRVDALALDPQRPEQLYVAASYLHGSTTLHPTPSHVASSSDGGANWNALNHEFTAAVVELLPVGGVPGSVYALTAESRAPLALYDAPEPVDSPDVVGVDSSQQLPEPARLPMAWVIAALAALALGIFVTYDLQQRGVPSLPQAIPLSALETQTVPTVS